MLKVEVVLRNPKMAIAILAQGESLDTRESSLEIIAQYSQQVVICKKKKKTHCSTTYSCIR